MFKISETTKIRSVFDATAREGNNPSLNDCLLKGHNLIELIPDILDRFRMYPIGLSADIEKAFLKISVTPEHRDFLRFFYPHENNEIVYRHCQWGVFKPIFVSCFYQSPTRKYSLKIYGYRI
ncbi:DUF1758 domain-containing protein [Trichonephila clavipes]|nr:DUF1758 domain-containing protein [Trichonephila clavipes]